MAGPTHLADPPIRRLLRRLLVVARAALSPARLPAGPGARVVFLDNRWVAGSSTPLADTDADADAEGNTFQCRRLRVLKNFPTPDEVRAQVHGMASDVQLDTWPHDWALAYRVD